MRCKEHEKQSEQVQLELGRMPYLLRWRGLHVALWGWRGLHDRLGWRRRWRWRMGVSSGRLVTRRRRHRLTCGSHDVSGLGRGVLGQHCGRSLVHGWRLGVLAGALPTQRHLCEWGRKLFSLWGIGMTSLESLMANALKTISKLLACI